MLKQITLILSISALIGVSSSYKVTQFLSDVIPDQASVKTDPFIKIGNGYYYFERVKEHNWYEAYENCRQMGAELISFDTEEEWKSIVQYMEDGRIGGYYWSSGNDLAESGKYKWFASGQPFSFHKWGPSQPAEGHCVYINYFPEGFGLGVSECGAARYESHYICETPKPVVAAAIIWK